MANLQRLTIGLHQDFELWKTLKLINRFHLKLCWGKDKDDDYDNDVNDDDKNNDGDDVDNDNDDDDNSGNDDEGDDDGDDDDDDDESDDDGGAPTLTSPMFPSLSVCVPPHLHLLLCSSPPLPAPRFFFLFFPISSPFFL